jgi:hypothetical protein
MSAPEFWEDLLHLNVSHAWERLKDFYNSSPASIKVLVAKLKTDTGAIVKADCAIAAKDIVVGGILNTDAYVTAAKDIFARLPADSVLLLTDVFAILNAETSLLLGTTDQAA